jgi:hypothetical protein
METSNSLTYFMPGGAPRAGIDDRRSVADHRVPYNAELDRLECLIEEARLRDRSRRPARRASYDSVADRLAEGADVSFLTEQGYLNY